MAKETRQYKHSKLNPKGAPVFSKNHPLVRFLVKSLTPDTKGGETVPFDRIVSQVRQAKVLRIDHPESIREMISVALRENSVPNFASKRGPKGGVFHIPSYKKAYGADDYENLRVSTERAALASK